MRSLKYKICFYEDLVYNNGKILDKKISKKDKIILRSPYHPYKSHLDYRFFAKKLLIDYYDNILLDRECYLNFPFYEDKLFQTDFFIRNKINIPKTIFAQEPRQFPVIVKKRISSRNKGNFIINSQFELKNFFKTHNYLDYLIQEYIKTKGDYRILILKNKILDIVKRKANKITNTATLPDKIKNQALKITKLFKADFTGVDVIESQDNRFYFLEINLSPQFRSFERVTGVDVMEKIMQY